MENENENKSPLSEYQKKEINRIVEQAKTENEIENELRTDTRFVNFFQSYLPESVDSFIQSYKRKKSFLMQYGPRWIAEIENESLKWIIAAQEHLGYIQQKKLFDAQCLWRAEQITIPEVEICYDFEVWERNVLHCPFIEPITESDIDLYARYLQQENVDFSLGWFREWQDYDDIKNAYNKEDADNHFPEWYDFHINNKGGSYLLSLPDTRGEKEDFYMDITRAHNAEKNKANVDEYQRTRDKRPYLESTYDADFMRFFIKTFENKQLLEYYEAYKTKQEVEDKEHFNSIFNQMLSEKELIPIQAHYDWREALNKAHAAYKAKKIAEHLPQAFEEYQLHLSLQIQSESALEEFERYKEFRKSRANYILNGRELNGEPRDFNF